MTITRRLTPPLHPAHAAQSVGEYDELQTTEYTLVALPRLEAPAPKPSFHRYAATPAAIASFDRAERARAWAAWHRHDWRNALPVERWPRELRDAHAQSVFVRILAHYTIYIVTRRDGQVRMCTASDFAALDLL